MQWDENLELHHKLMTSFWLAAVTLCHYLHQIRDPCCNRIKSLTFAISNLKTSQDRGITSFPWKYQFPWNNSPVHYSIFLRWDKNLEWHHKLITSLWQAAVVLWYLRQVEDGSCKKIKSLTFLITNANILYHIGITSFPSRYQFPWINSHVASFCNEITIKILWSVKFIHKRCDYF